MSPKAFDEKSSTHCTGPLAEFIDIIYEEKYLKDVRIDHI
jgi:hypothetical protein